MPVLGNAGTAGTVTPASAAKPTGTGSYGVGYGVPAGSLENLRAGFAAASSALCELTYFGDSTSFGSGADGGPPRKLRSLLLAAGLTDGGRGVASPNETSSSSGESLLPLVGRTGWGVSGHAYDFLNTDSLNSNTNGDVMTWQGKGTAIRLHATRVSAGSFSYAIDGAAAVTVTSTPPGGVTADILTTYVGGLTEGTHTVVITNLGTAAAVVPEFIRGAGVVVHKQAISGISTNAFFDRTKSSQSGFGNAPALAALGLQQRNGNTPANGMDYGLAAATKPTARNVKAAIFALGINDQQGQATDDTTAYAMEANVVEGFGIFVRMCRQAAIDPIAVVPHFVYASRADLYSTRLRSALVGAAVAHGCAWVDLNTAVGPITSGTWSGAPHLSQTQADAEAQFLYDKVLSLALPGA